MQELTDKNRKAAGRIAGHAELVDVRLFDANVKLTSPTFPGGLSFKLDTDIEYQLLDDDKDGPSVAVTGAYSVTVFQSDDDGDGDAESMTVAEVSFQLAALFDLSDAEEGDEPYADDEVAAFATTTGQFLLYPYARGFVVDITSRMGIPPLHLPILKLGRDGKPLG